MTDIAADTANRVADKTPQHVKDRIQYNTEASLLHFAQRLDDVEMRLNQLKEEWDIERALQTWAGFMISSTLLLGLFKKRWRLVSMLAAGFLVMHSVNGWRPPVPLLRRLGVRTAREINRERYALKALRGDFAGCEPAAPGDVGEKARIAAGAVSTKFNPVLPESVYACEEPLNVP